MPEMAKGNGTGVRPGMQPKTKTPRRERPHKFTYALKAWTAERRDTGWFVSVTVPSFNGAKPDWRGPFATIETACLSIARGQANEIADRHTRSVEGHKIARSHPLYGFKPTTKLRGCK